MKNIKTDVKKIKQALLNSILVIIGTAILAFGTAIFMFPFDLVAGGISGISIIIENLLPAGAVSIDILVTVITWALFILGFATLGRSFAAKTLLSSLVYPIFISIFIKLVSPNVMSGYFYLPASEYSDIAIIIAALVGGALIGVGCAIAFLGGGSTGGTDILAFLITKFFPKLRSSKVIFAIDAIIVLLGVFVIKDLVISVLGIASAFVSAALVDKVFLGGTRALTAEIISTEYDRINRDIIDILKRTTTVFDVTGGYSGEKKKLLRVTFTVSEYPEILNIVTRADKYAFITVHTAHEISGEGWTR